jgi:uncharacterized membrane protein
MVILIVGLALFLGIHSIRMGPDSLRAGLEGRLGVGGYKGVYSLVALAGFALVIWGYGQARLAPVVLWTPPTFARHGSLLLMLLSMILLVAAYIPNNALKQRLHHPMVLAVKVWALAHLIANGNLADGVLFGSFLIWAIFNFRAARQRDRAAGLTPTPAKTSATVITVLVGTAAWAALLMGVHRALIGVSPMG